MNQDELDEVLRLHKLWLNGDPEGRRADFYKANLRNVDLQRASLQGVDLWNADLSHTNLSYANLSHTNLSYANLSYANLSYASLRDSDLRGVEINPDNSSVMCQLDNITILDTGLDDFCVFTTFTTSCIPKDLIKKEVNNFKQLITVLSLNSQ